MKDFKTAAIFGGRFLLPRRPQRPDALPECFRLLGKKPPGQALRRFQMRAAARRNRTLLECTQACAI